MMIGKIIRFGRRQLHTIVSREIIKPSSPSPSHLRTYNLSQLDQAITHIFNPLLLFYPKNETCSLTPYDKAQMMKKSLSQSLTRYYPFAGRLHTPETPYIDCNDEGVVFVEAKHDSEMEKFQHIIEEEEGETVGQLFADGMVWKHSPHNPSLLLVQVNHFSCGGIGLAVSLSHIICDGCTLGSFMSHWASVAHYGSTDHKEVLPLNPHFLRYPAITSPFRIVNSVSNLARANRVTKKFVFPNSKLSELKNKILASGKAGSTLSIDSPTRVDVLTSLIYKSMVAAKSGSLTPTFLFIPVNMRKNFVPKLPQSTVGNIVSSMMITTKNERETSLSTVVSEIRKQKMELEGVQSIQQVTQRFMSLLSTLGDEDMENVDKGTYWGSSFCRFPFNKVNFGWGNPTVARASLGSSDSKGFLLMDTPNGDGIEARVTIETQDMEIFQNDKELLSFCQII